MDKLKQAMGNHLVARVNNYLLNWSYISIKHNQKKLFQQKKQER